MGQKGPFFPQGAFFRSSKPVRLPQKAFGQLKNDLFSLLADPWPGRLLGRAGRTGATIRQNGARTPRENLEM